MKTIKILLAEDEYEITEILTAYLRNEKVSRSCLRTTDGKPSHCFRPRYHSS